MKHLLLIILAMTSASAVDATHKIPSQNNFDQDYGLRFPGDVLNLT
jgi:hypothetical protein